MAFFRFTEKTDHTAVHGKAEIIFDFLVSISVFFVHRPLSESRSCEVSLNMDLDMDEDMLPTSPPPSPASCSIQTPSRISSMPENSSTP